ncbi:interferon a3-like, partial [Clarias magur]
MHYFNGGPSVSSGFSCRWINVKFKQHHGTCLALLREMGEEISTNSSIPDNWHHWFFNQSYSQPEKQIGFIVQTLDEVSRLLEESDSVSWNKDKLDTLLHMLDLQANGLRSCLDHKVKKSKRLPLYFKRLRDLTKNDKGEEISTISSIPDNWHHWFFNQSYSQPEKQIRFIVQTLDEVSRLLEESDSVSWNMDKLDTLLHMLDQQANGLRSCLGHKVKKSKRLPLYFKRLRDLTKNDKPENQIGFIVQTLDEVSRLLEESDSVSWNKDKLDTLLHMLDLQANGLRSCLDHKVKKSKRLPLYFKRLRDLTKNDKGEEISTNSSIPENWHHWFFNQSYSQPENQIGFIVQTLDEVSRLLEESDSVSWNKDKLDTLLHMLDLQANGLRSCLDHKVKKSKRLPLYFKRLRDLTKNDK